MGKLTSFPLIAITFGAIGFLVFFLLPPIAKKIIDQKIVLRNGSALYNFWKDMPLPVLHKFYFYNITNPSDVEKYGAKPNLSEIGPFTYLLRTHNIPVNNPNGTITFLRNRTWTFDRESSSMDENTSIYTVNVPLVIALTWIEKGLPGSKVIEEALATLDHGFIIERTVKELTFTGYQDIFMELGSIFVPKATAGYNGKFAYFHHKNGSTDNLYQIFSGVNDINKLNLLTLINGQKKLGIWADELGEDNQECNRFNDSTLGEMFPPLRNKPISTIKIFAPDLTRTLSFSYQKSHFLFEKLETKKFLFSEHNFASPNIYPPNKCYTSLMTSHSFDGTNGTLPTGVFDASTPNFGFPIFLSLPHFLGADPYYLTKVDGLSPNESAHLGWFDIEPISGATAATAVRLQLNIGITRSNLFKRNHQMPNIVFPTFWMEISFTLSSDIVDLLIMANTVLSLVPTLILAIGVSLAGFLLFISSLQLLVPRRSNRFTGCLNILTCHRYKIVKDDEQKILDPEDNSENRNEALTN